jgi:hypothetical protein
MQFDGTNFYLSSYTGGTINSTTNVLTLSTLSGYSGFFDYFVSDGTNSRAGTVMTVWNDSTSNYTDYSTPDLGGSTTGLTFSTSVSGGNINLTANVSGGGTWTIKVGSRILM